ncbi:MULTISPECIES: phosphoribosylanthranilate isomerase [unclassified Tolypothrix]|uniref:phosphoribosylanthranilate isomerase n=1 Tax=unclassified Tolypothrix TaxID=2649714 RepID=UPI0005EAC215|nr:MULTISPECIES: phosphoribosylanthranilate isomerase [unclassified Tolypothrix]BAY94176.1 N-(5'-phosphoribosyl)anthranilate isomerase [Microchaete diplosiphon NIES-3275]EKF03753.1 N-(5'phosphoribosyl)anthranilate isomerase [Tolypothrix sp. PCC 7601]MBE9084357.1 phosphoribosylanthranilate isomerase [Tolypothrix sp. LEGE 11397]UYD27926.1 phosphoribosylanthranilate isomerase [Tolypothrix sp. PCC 7712]UYD36206.1 phosphoribosylanthranilate isomerase [Tolypothrix sp. PCC 7601]
MRIKICGITQPQQSVAIASLGATALGFICVPTSPRYVNVQQIKAAVAPLPHHIDKIGVFANSSIPEITQTVVESGLTSVQLHGNESPEFCQQLRQALPGVEIIKALRIRSHEHLQQVTEYTNYIDTLLLDAYHPQHLGGTGQTLDWTMLQQFSPGCPWFLAGGLTPDNILDALSLVKPNGIDLSSGVERKPGDKDLDLVAKLFLTLNSYGSDRTIRA